MEQKRFRFISDARDFREEMKKMGITVTLKVVAGTHDPHTIASWEPLFDIVLSKNRIANFIKSKSKEFDFQIPEYISFDFKEIEKIIGTFNQPTAEDILNKG